MAYAKTFDDHDVLNYLNSDGYKQRENVLHVVAAGDIDQVNNIMAQYMDGIRKLYQFYDLNWAREAAYDFLAQISGAATVGGLDSWEARKIKETYYAQLDQAETVGAILDIYDGYVYAFTQAVRAHNEIAKYSEPVREVFTYIRQNINERLTIGGIAADLHFSASSISHRVKEESGVTVQEAIQIMKITEAKTLLREHYSVADVAAQLSFSSQSYFSKVFKQVTGVSPKEWLKSNK